MIKLINTVNIFHPIELKIISEKKYILIQLLNVEMQLGYLKDFLDRLFLYRLLFKEINHVKIKISGLIHTIRSYKLIHIFYLNFISKIIKFLKKSMIILI